MAKYACVKNAAGGEECFEDRGTVGMYPLFVTGADPSELDADQKPRHPLGMLQTKPPSSAAPEGGHACSPSELKAFLDAANAIPENPAQAIPEFCVAVKKTVKAEPAPK